MAEAVVEGSALGMEEDLPPERNDRQRLARLHRSRGTRATELSVQLIESGVEETVINRGETCTFRQRSAGR
jgi:hypothetical protein